jgi:hypothetical protein
VGDRSGGVSMIGWTGDCGCFCGATLRKWNSAGDLLWSRARGRPAGGGLRYDQFLLLDESNNRIYTYGSNISGESTGAVNRYDSIHTSSPSLAWVSDANGLSDPALDNPNSTYVYSLASARLPLVLTSDDHLVRLFPNSGGLNSILRTDISNGHVVTQTTAYQPLTPHRVLNLGSGEVALNGGAPNRLRVLDDTLTSIADVSPPELITRFASDRIFTAIAGSPAYGLRSDALASVLSGATTTGFRGAVTDGTYAFVADATGFAGTSPRFARYSFAGSVALDWSNTTFQSSGSGYAPPAPTLLELDDSGRLFTVVEKAGAVSKIQRRDVTNGSIVWEYDVGVSKGTNIGVLRAKGGVVVALGKWFNGASSTQPRNIIALNASTGAFLWDKFHEFPTGSRGLTDACVDGSGNVYACGHYSS